MFEDSILMQQDYENEESQDEQEDQRSDDDEKDEKDESDDDSDDDDVGGELIRNIIEKGISAIFQKQ